MKLIVDKLPSGCAECLFYSGMFCQLLNKPAPDSTASRLRGCPLMQKVEPWRELYLSAYGTRTHRIPSATYITDVMLNNRTLLRTVVGDAPAGWI